MKPEGIRKVIAERSLEGAIIYLAEQMEAGAGEAAHEQGNLLQSMQGKLEELSDRVVKLEGASTAPTVQPSTGEGA